MPPPRLKPIELVGIAAATGVGWGIVMALVSWARDGAEIVLLQAFYLVPAWFFGRATREPGAGALAGFAMVLAAVYTFELLPMWGLEAALRREALTENVPFEQIGPVVDRLDREDIALFSTLAVGALVGLAGGLHGRAPGPVAAVAPPLPAPAPPAAPVPAAEPLWAGYGRPQPPAPAPDPLLEPAPPPPAPAPERARRGTPWGAAFLLAACATDICLERLFDMYSAPQAGVAIALVLAGLLATFWFARRHAIFMAVAGVVLASAFAAVQHAEYEARKVPTTLVR